METYATADQIKAHLNVDGDQDDAIITSMLIYATRAIEDFCRRRFAVEYGVREFDTVDGRCVMLTDLLSADLVQLVDCDGVATETEDYRLLPLNSYPKLLMYLEPSTRFRGVRVTGWWGYGDGRRALPFDTVELTGTIGATGTTLSVSGSVALAVGQTIRIEDEIMRVASFNVQLMTAKVERGANGTTTAAHSAAPVLVASYPASIVHATVAIASEYFATRGNEHLVHEMQGDYQWRKFEGATGNIVARMDQMVGKYTVRA